MAVFLLMALFIALEQEEKIRLDEKSKRRRRSAHTPCPPCPHRHVHLHGVLVEGNVDELHAKVMRCFVEGRVDAHGCQTAQRRREMLTLELVFNVVMTTKADKSRGLHHSQMNNSIPPENVTFWLRNKKKNILPRDKILL